jgi:hypothetical protein
MIAAFVASRRHGCSPRPRPTAPRRRRPAGGARVEHRRLRVRRLAGSALAYLRFDPVHAVTTMALCSIAMQAYAVWQLRASIRWRALARCWQQGAGHAARASRS